MWAPLDLHWYFPGSAFPCACPVCMLRCWLRSLCWVFPYYIDVAFPFVIVNMIALNAGDHPRRGPEGRVVGVVARPEGPSRRADRGGRHNVREVVDVPEVATGGGDALVRVKRDRL